MFICSQIPLLNCLFVGRWMTSYKIRIQDSVDLINQGHSLQGCMSSKKSVSGGLSRVNYLLYYCDVEYILLKI